MGDFNAHVGHQDLLPDDRTRVGKFLYHPWSNANGDGLKYILKAYNYRLCSSFGPSPSVLCTWNRGRNRSQIDHVLMPIIPRFQRPMCRCAEGTADFSDHHMLLMTARHRHSPNPGQVTHQGTDMQFNANAERVGPMNYQVSMLTTDPVASERYSRTLSTNLATSNGQGHTDPNTLIDLTVTAMLDAAERTLNRPRSPQTPRRAKAGRDAEKIQRELLANRRNAELKRKYREARKRKSQAYEDHQEEKVKAFFDNLENYPVLDRIRLTFRYLKRHRRRATQGATTYIPVRSWEEKLKSSASHAEVALLPEPIGPPEDSGPTLHDVVRLSRTLRNGTAAGTDGVRPELIRYGPESLHQRIHQMLQDIWQHNQVPARLLETVQVPIPKIPRPKSVDEYRRITLCSSIYKIYARYLLEQLESYLENVENYQYAYHNNRSAEDQIFIVRQMLDERWRKGRTTYCVSRFAAGVRYHRSTCGTRDISEVGGPSIPDKSDRVSMPH